jgi:hypothetical protein
VCGRATRRHPRRWVILALILAAECMDLLDGTIVKRHVQLPRRGGNGPTWSAGRPST